MADSLKEIDELPMLTREARIDVSKRATGDSMEDEREDDEERKDCRSEDDPDDDGDDDSDPDLDTDDDEGKDERAAKVTHKRKSKKAGKRQAEMGQDDDETEDDSDNDGMESLADENNVGMGRAYPMSLSSETPVDQWFGTEVLSHDRGAVDLSRADGMPLLLNHDPEKQIGVVNNLQLGKDRTLRGDIVFSKSARDIEQDVQDGIRRNMSVGYRVNQYDVERGQGNAPDTYTARSWTPMEASIVSVPADHTVGVNRSAREKFPVRVRSLGPVKGREKGESNMSEVNTAPNKGEQAAEIVRLAGQHGMLERAADWLAQGRTIDEVRAEILAARASAPIKQPAAEQSAGLNEREAKQYSYARAISLAADMAEGKRVSGFELEVSQDMEKRMPQSYKGHGGLFIPTALRNVGPHYQEGASGSGLSEGQRAAALDYLTRAGTMDSATANAIKEVVFTEYGGELINILRNTALVTKMGARVLTGLSSPVAFPRQTADVAAVWQAMENPGANITNGQVNTDLVTLMPRTLMAATAYSRQLLVQSSVDVEAMVRESIAASHALAWDLAALHGTGSNGQPLGIYNTTGVNTEDFSSYTTAHALNYGQLVDMEAKVANSNALLGTLGWLTTPTTAKKGKTTLEFPSVNGAAKIWDGTILEGTMDGYVARATNQVAKTMGANGAATGGTYHGLIFGNWADLLIGQFGGAMELIVDPYSLKKQALIEVSSFQMADVAVRHPVSFCVATNMDPTA